MPAEVVADSIAQAVGSPKLAEQMMTDMEMRSTGPKAASGSYNSNSAYALTVFGKPVRETTCDCERSNDPTLLQTIYTRNDPNIWALFNQTKTSWIKEIESREALHAKAMTRYKAQLANYQRSTKTYEQKLASYERQATKRPEMKQKIRQLKKQAPKKPVEPKLELAHDLGSMIDDVFLRTVSRLPNGREKAQAIEDVSKAERVSLGLRDLMWTMLNTKEFVVNH
jgi:hypothetical protein